MGDGDMKNSTFSQELLKVDKNRYIEGFICEQNMLGVGIGVACRDRAVAFASTFAATERATELAANTRGICFLRVSRPATPVVYPNDEVFTVGKAKVVRKSDSDQVLVVAAGVTLHEAIKAADTLAEKGINIRVMDPFTIKPLDIAAVQDNAAACNGRIITVEDHYPEGGIGDAVLDAVASYRNMIVRKLAVNAVPRSGPPAELLDMFGISADNIVKAVNDVVKL